MIIYFFLYCRTANAQANVYIVNVSLEPSLLVYRKYGHRPMLHCVHVAAHKSIVPVCHVCVF